MFDFSSLGVTAENEVLRIWIATTSQGERSSVVGRKCATLNSQGLLEDLLLCLEHLTAMIKALSDDRGEVTGQMVDMVQTMPPLTEVYVFDYAALKAVRIYAAPLM